MRLDKFFSELKILSRREIVGELKKGFITVNDVVIKKSDFKIVLSFLSIFFYHINDKENIKSLLVKNSLVQQIKYLSRSD